MSRFLCCFAVIAAAWAAPVRAADIFLEVPKDTDKMRTEYANWLKDEASPPTADQLKQTDLLARYLVNRLTQKNQYHNTPGAMAGLVADCDRWIKLALAPETKNGPLGQALGKKMVDSLEQVLAPPDQLPITRVNASRVLALLAGTGFPDTADLLVKVIIDPKEVDGARYWACRGLRDLYEKNPKATAGAQRQKAIEALVPFIERANKLSKDTPSEEVEGLRVVRREAIRALGALRDPGVADKAGGQAAWTLLRVLHSDKALTPEPRLDEQVEAAIGLCNMRPDAKGDYQPAYAAFHVGQFVLEFYANSRKSGPKRDPWKIYAARMDEALQALAVAFPTDATISSVAKEAGAVLRGIQQGAGAVTEKDLRSALMKMKPPASVYKSNPKAVIESREER